jgi:predicted nucleic acid-binding protein
LEALEGLELFVELRRIMGAGEASCLALAKGNGWIVASDEKGAFRREASRLVGTAGIITTVDIYVLSIHAGLLTVAQADAAKAILAANRFALPFGSFEELVHE